MKTQHLTRSRGFTLLETVIAIGVLAVLLTGFMVVFAPAADGIRKSINVQQADRMASALEQELVTLRTTEISGDIKTGFDKSFYRIKDSTGPIVNNEDKGDPQNALLAYQYRAKIDAAPRADGTLVPEPSMSGKPGENYVVVPMVRQKKDPEFTKDLEALEGAVYLVKATQLVFDAGQLKSGTAGKILDPKDKTKEAISATLYPEAVIAFSADFYLMPAKAKSYFEGTSSPFNKNFPKLKSPVFTRNLAVRR